MTLVEDTKLTLRRGTIPALGAMLALGGPGAIVTALLAAFDPTGLTVTFFVGWFLLVPGILAAAFAAYSTALERDATVRETLALAVTRGKKLLGVSLVALVPATFIPVGAFIVVELVTRAATQRLDDAIFVAPVLALLGLYVWTFHVVVPATAAFRPVTYTERFDVLSKLQLMLATNAPFFPLIVFSPTLPNPVMKSIPQGVALPLWVGGFLLAAIAGILLSAAIGVAAVARR